MTSPDDTLPPAPTATEPPLPVRIGLWLCRSRLSYLVVLLFGLAIFLPGQRSIPAIDRDEARFAQSSRQMLETRDFIDIRFQDELRLKKPVGIYWLQATATALAGGEDPANPIRTYRIPSLIGALGALLLTLAIGRRWFGPEAGLLAALLLGSTLLLSVEARQAKTDAVLLAVTLAAMAGLAEAWMPKNPGQPPARWRWVGFWVAIGVGLLVKGPVMLLVVGLAALTLSILDRRIGWLARLRPWPGIAVAFAIAAPWLIAITVSTRGAFLHESLGHDFAAKIAGGQESHGAPPGTYLLELPLLFWPSSLFLAAATAWAVRNRRDRAVQFCAAWLIPAWLVFEAVPTKLPHYVLPLYPAIALLVGAWLADRNALGRAGLAGRLWLGLWMLLGLVLGGVLIAAAPVADGRLSFGGLLAGLAVWAATAGLALLRRREARIATVAAAASTMILAWGLAFGMALPALDAPWVAPRLKEVLFRAMPAGHGPVFLAGYAEPSAVIALGTGTRFGQGADAAAALEQEPGTIAVVSDDQKTAFDTELGARHLTVATIGDVHGFNYSKGKRVHLTIVRRAE